MRFLLDTNVLSEPARETPNRKVLAKLAQFQGVVATATPALHELLFGLHRLPAGSKRSKLEDFLASSVKGILALLPYDADAAEWHAKERARLESVGLTPPFVDGQIAAVAAVNGLVLVTRNIKNFKIFEGLQVVSWHA